MCGSDPYAESETAMCRLAEAEFAADAAAPGAARTWITGLLEAWDLPALAETAALLASETVTNAVRHAASAPTVTVAVSDGVVEVGVTDRDPDSSPHMKWAGDPMATSGRGLAIVDVLADEWGTASLTHGKQVWFRLAATGWSHATECHCHGDDPAGTELRSGRRVLVNSRPGDRVLVESPGRPRRPTAVPVRVDRWAAGSTRGPDRQDSVKEEAMATFSRRATDVGDVHLVTLVGELDMATSAGLTEWLVDLAGSALVIDLSELTFLDSSGIACPGQGASGDRAGRE